MMNTIFKKMLVLALLFSLGSIICSSLLIGILLEKQMYDKTQTTLISKAKDMNEEVKRYIKGEINRDELKQSILSLKEKDNIQVKIMTEQRNSLFEDENPKVQKWLDEVMESKSGIGEITFDKNEQIKMFIVGIPLLVENENKGAVVLYTPMRETVGLIHDINKIIAFSVLLLIVPIIFVSWLLSKKMVAPIVSMSHTVSNISKGNFEEQVTLKGKDELVTLGEAINSMSEKLAIIEQSRRRFIGEISHELRTPLTTIRTTLQGLADKIFNRDEEKEFINLSIDEIKRISKLIDDLIDLSALEEKAVTLSKENTSISGIIENAILQLSLKAKEKEIGIVKNIEKDVWANVDIDRLKQVLINLLDNAIKHSDIHSQVKVVLLNNQESFKIEIENTGNRLPLDKIPYLFDRFYKADKSRSEKGNGLGLTISKQIVELHKGTISVQTNSDKVNFIVDIPHDC